jgi:GWxTD domain-containing protein
LFIWLRRALCLTLLLPLLYTAHAADRAKELPARYRHWVSEEVAYIISSAERKQFLNLHSDAERDNFIRAFWSDRNPNPGSDSNLYKEEHYRRLAYANEHFGHAGTGDGWQSDQGRIYITLGAPQQKADYELAQNVRPMQIWFYQSSTPALPIHFYIVFYKPSPAEDWQLYSPTFDTPTKLVSTTRGMNDPQQCLNIIRKSLGDEVARTVLSLIPTGPVDLSSYTPDLQSDSLLANIQSLADNPITLRQLAERRATNVTSTIFYGGNEPDLETATFRAAGDRMTVSYLLRFARPEPSLIGRLSDGKFGYHVTLHTQVLTSAGAPIYDEEHVLTARLGEAEVRNAQAKIFGAEGRLPLAPGKYRIVATLTNDLTHAGYRQYADVKVPSAADTEWGISSPVAFSPQPPLHAPQLALPFSIEGIRFVPLGAKSVFIRRGETLRLAFQLWSNPANVTALAADAIRIHYAYGSVGSGEPQQETEEVDGRNFDASGNLLTGHTFSTAALGPGNYRLVITATDEKTNRSAYASMLIHVVDDPTATDMWTVFDNPRTSQASTSQDDYRRGLSAAASGDQTSGAHWFQEALTEDPGNLRDLSGLVGCLAASGQQTRIAALSQQLPQSKDLDVHTAVLLARADAKQGNPKHALQILEYELQFQPPSAELYQALADTYEQTGQMTRAREFRNKLAKL